MNRLLGVVCIIISAAAFGTLAIFGRYAYAGGLDTFTLLFLRFTFSALLMAGLLVLRREALPRGATLARLAGMGAIGYVGQSFCYLSAIQYASAGLVALLLYLYPVFVAILSAIFLKEKIQRRKIIALGLATLGLVLTVHPQGGQWSGILLALSAAGIYSVYIIVGAGVMKQVSAIQSSLVIFASAGIVFGVLTALRGPHWPVSGGLAGCCRRDYGRHGDPGGDLPSWAQDHRANGRVDAFHPRAGGHGIAGGVAFWGIPAAHHPAGGRIDPGCGDPVDAQPDGIGLAGWSSG
jgi:drug/metabolite transporter (DMT)-like permease